jgi:dTDP-4-dehydrorhamnose 3,5-epimerase-like enzyme
LTQQAPYIIELPKMEDDRGNLTFIQHPSALPFEIKRTYWVYDVPGGKERGSHAYKTNTEFVVALSGSFDVVVNNGQQEQIIHLSRSYYGLLIPKMTWRKFQNFSTNSLVLVLSDSLYNADDYIRDFENFQTLLNE